MEEEIDLEQILMVLWKRRIFIGAVFAIFFIAGISISAFKRKMYRAVSTIMITPSKIEFIKTPLDPSLSLPGKMEKSVISLATHEKLLMSDAIMSKVKDKLDESKLEGAEFNIEISKGTSLIDLYVLSGIPQNAQDICNVWTETYLELSRGIVSVETRSSKDFLYGEYKESRESLESNERKLEKFYQKNRYEQLKATLNILKDKMSSYEKNIINKKDDLKLSNANLESLKDEIKNHVRFITIAKAVSDDALWQKVEKNEDAWKNLKDKKMVSQIINPVYQNLEKDISDTEVRIKTIAKELSYIQSRYETTEKEVLAMGDKIDKMSTELTAIQRDKGLAGRRYDAVFSKLTDAELAARANLGDVKIISLAGLPGSPFAPDKRKIILLAAASGLFFGVLGAFFAEFAEKHRLPA
ncbi:MAG: Wzz/FepE/Etk N-terminal domain-containing protein [bacterium]